MYRSDHRNASRIGYIYEQRENKREREIRMAAESASYTIKRNREAAAYVSCIGANIGMPAESATYTSTERDQNGSGIGVV